MTATMEIATRLIVNRAGHVFLVLLDPADAPLYDLHRWCVSLRPNGDVAYVGRGVPRPGAPGQQDHVKLHRQLFGYVPGECPETLIDHKNGNPLDNRRGNLRLATAQQNNQNAKVQSNNISGHRGVHFHKRCNKFLAQICIDGKRKHLGYFATAAEASVCYEAAARAAFGAFYRQLY
jgi:hypothetical protein